MQGFILHSHRVKDEDIIAHILTKEALYKTYRFYGARHSSVLLGFKIDFELVENAKFIPHLRSVLHLGFSWLRDRERLLLWQQFMRLLFEHLRGVDEVDEIYFNELDLCASRFHRQNPKRLLIESYVRILEHEGRLHSECECFICDEPIDDDVALARGFLPAHTHCLSSAGFDKTALLKLYETHSSAHFDDDSINRLYQILMLGI
ncbi:recombination protein RecO [Campylobacter sp. 19-13652]|uniref:recombination protein RecO n=1 Tax=Campylobacter sp. 19-13652 TaxID=2840180 RepID=UPI001C750C0E|nr:recombination protein RecO [Campylobacter sp. 19-13652]BCX79879.1 recombination protein RecO [Campylobacter sp. 19-13652]